MKKWIVIIAVLLTPFIFGMSIHKISTDKFDEQAAIKTAKEIGKDCFVKEKFVVPSLHNCSREDQVAYSMVCTDLSTPTVCCGLMKDCSVSLK